MRGRWPSSVNRQLDVLSPSHGGTRDSSTYGDGESVPADLLRNLFARIGALPHLGDVPPLGLLLQAFALHGADGCFLGSSRLPSVLRVGAFGTDGNVSGKGTAFYSFGARRGLALFLFFRVDETSVPPACSFGNRLRRAGAALVGLVDLALFGDHLVVELSSAKGRQGLEDNNVRRGLTQTVDGLGHWT